MSRLDSLLARTRKLEADLLVARENSPEAKVSAELARVQDEIKAEEEKAHQAELARISGELEALKKDMRAQKSKVLTFAAEYVRGVEALNERAGKVLGAALREGLSQNSLYERMYLESVNKYFTGLLHQEEALEYYSKRQK